jgi:para-nitrobenzyl esterase
MKRTFRFIFGEGKGDSERRCSMVFIEMKKTFKNTALLSLLFSLVILVALLLTGITSFAQGSGGLPQNITIESGKISGQALGGNKDVMAFKGIPYAKAPVGSLRWKPPEKVEAWEGIRESTAYGPVCVQPDVLLAWGVKFGKQSEDCLSLNVWTAAKSADDRRPVMMWIHGGGNVAGANQIPTNDGEALARQGVVVVSINYRIGIFGYFAHPLLSKESPDKVSGNYGLLDMIAALKWIQDNIKAFGGDPDRVTIFGESAGATNVSFLMASPFAKGLFHRAIAESGTSLGLRSSRHLRERWYGNEPMEKQGERIVKDLGYSEAADLVMALRSLSAEKLVEGSKASMLPAPGKNTFGPVIDGWALPDDLMTLFEEGKQNLVPLMAGTNADEMTLFIPKPPFDNVEAYQSMVKKMYGTFADDVLAKYPVNKPQDIRKSMCDSQGDAIFVASTRRFVRSMQKAGGQAYLYHYTMAWPGRLAAVGAFHGGEMIFVFDNVSRSKEPFGEKHRNLAKVMSGYWVQFAATGNPNMPGAVEWPVYDSSNDQHLVFGEVIKVDQGLRKEKCDLWDNFVAAQRKNR